MANHYEILRKANLAEELFRDGEDEEASEQAAADRAWARGAGVGSPSKERRPAPAERMKASHLRSLATPAVRGWAQSLAEVAGNLALARVSTLGVCPAERGAPETSAALGLARWIAQQAEKPVLLVEAGFREPRHAQALQAANVGINEAWVRRQAVSTCIQDTSVPNLKLLPAGQPVEEPDRSGVVDMLPAMIASLRPKFSAIVVELPAADDPVFKKLPLPGLVDAVILAADSRTAPPRKLRRAANRLRRTFVPFAGTLLEPLP
jgi:Mrp family chromosome partitioning ATPase